MAFGGHTEFLSDQDRGGTDGVSAAGWCQTYQGGENYWRARGETELGSTLTEFIFLKSPVMNHHEIPLFKKEVGSGAINNQIQILSKLLRPLNGSQVQSVVLQESG